jgi:Family of unknown function (DUF6156)
MKMLILLIVVVTIALGAFVVRLAQAKARRNHDPVEYYRGWDGYRHPIRLSHKITREEADALAAVGSAYLIGYFDAEGRLVHVVKMLRGSVFFEYAYTYHANGKRKNATVTRSEDVTVLAE